MKRNNLLILFSKWPKKGLSKSRISNVIGEDHIEDFCFACLDDIIRKLKTLEGIEVIIVPNTSEESFLFIQKYKIPSISLESIGISSDYSKSQIFSKVFGYFLERYKKVSLIPMDIPHINKDILEESFQRLNYSDQVFGPEINGGVYLMGLKMGQKNVFNNVRWSTENSFNDLINNCKNPEKLSLFFDLNTISDIICLNEERLSDCPALTRFIKSFVQEKIIMKKEVLNI